MCKITSQKFAEIVYYSCISFLIEFLKNHIFKRFNVTFDSYLEKPRAGKKPLLIHLDSDRFSFFEMFRTNI